MGEPLTPVYVLATNVNAQQAADLISAAPQPASLAGVAASLRTL
ncbi:hypothetical protein [Streptomyces sp. NPDC059928]